MKREKSFCEFCKEATEYRIEEKRLKGMIRGRSYAYRGQVTYCLSCGRPVTVESVRKSNLEKLYKEYRKAENLATLEEIRTIPERYKIGKRPLSMLLGWGEHTYTRYCEGSTPTRHYSDEIKHIYQDPRYYLSILEANHSWLPSDLAYRKSKLAVMTMLADQTDNVKEQKSMIQFGTGGWRAVIGEDFIESNIKLVAEGICALAKEENKTEKPVMIGYDHRFLSQEAAQWMAEVLTTNGIKVWFMNRSAPTPLVMHTVMKQKLYYGIEITASHNPAKYNGVKLIVEEGRDAPVETTKRLEKLIAASILEDYLPFNEAVSKGLVTYLKNPFNDFIDDILSVLNVKAIRNHGARILFDPMYGSGTYPIIVILNTARCTVDMIHNGHDALFGGAMPAPSTSSLAELRSKVVAEKYELGIGFDGDGDRIGIIDGNGRYFTANEILVMLYWYLHEIKGWKGPVVRNLATTHMLDAVAKDLGETCYEVPVGFKYISSKIDEVNAVLGGESSGGLTVRGHIHGKDSIYAASLFVEMISVLEKTPTEIITELEKKYGHYEMVEDNIAFTPAEKAMAEQRIFEEKKLPDFSQEIDHVSYADGCKVYFKDGSFVICRFSGTEPLLRIFAEAGNEITARTYIEAFRKVAFGA